MSIKHSIDSVDFLANFWQKKPLLIRQAFEYEAFQLKVDEMAGLACEPEVESRLVMNRAGRYTLEQGPFSEKRLSGLDNKEWTLLIQALDHWSEEVFQLLEQVDFIPYWRTDDVMVSISAPGGSVGPHFDFYDVFLVQIQGNKIWRLGQKADTDTDLDNSSGLKLLRKFKEQQEIEVNPGDVLYIPPKLAHWGISDEGGKEACVTLSIGFRAPSYSEMIDDFAAEVCEELSEVQRFCDPSPSYEAPGEIPVFIAAQLRTIFEKQLFSRPEKLQQWFGKYMTLPRAEYCVEDEPEPVTLETNENEFIRAPGARMAYSNFDAKQTCFFVNGECLLVQGAEQSLVHYLCNRLRYNVAELKSLTTTKCGQSLLGTLLRQKVIIIPEASLPDNLR